VLAAASVPHHLHTRTAAHHGPASTLAVRPCRLVRLRLDFLFSISHTRNGETMFHFLSFFLEFSLFYLMIAQSNHAVVVCYHIRAQTKQNGLIQCGILGPVTAGQVVSGWGLSKKNIYTSIYIIETCLHRSTDICCVYIILRPAQLMVQSGCTHPNSDHQQPSVKHDGRRRTLIT
jgi:hypothetical protein